MLRQKYNIYKKKQKESLINKLALKKTILKSIKKNKNIKNIIINSIKKKNMSKTVNYNICNITGQTKGIDNKLTFKRNVIKNFAEKGYINNFTSGSW